MSSRRREGGVTPWATAWDAPGLYETLPERLPAPPDMPWHTDPNGQVIHACCCNCPGYKSSACCAHVDMLERLRPAYARNPDDPIDLPASPPPTTRGPARRLLDRLTRRNT